MLQKTIVIGSLFLSVAFAAPASACEFHEMGFGPMGSKWSAYYPDDPRHYTGEDDTSVLPNSADPSADDTKTIEPVQTVAPRPSFASVAIRAANTAKANLAAKNPQVLLEPKPISKSDR